MRICCVQPDDPRFQQLCRELDGVLDRLAGGAENRSVYRPYNTVEDLQIVLLAFVGSRPVGCAGLRRLDAQTGEVKRVFVADSFRRRGVGRGLLLRLEQLAKEDGIQQLLLETGDPLTEACALYRSLGYAVVPRYGPYRNLAESVCMGKRLCAGRPVVKKDRLRKL